MDCFEKNFKSNNTKEILFKKYNTYGFIIDGYIKRDNDTLGKYAVFKIWFLHSIEEKDIFDRSRWVETVNVKVFREYEQKYI